MSKPMIAITRVLLAALLLFGAGTANADPAPRSPPHRAVRKNHLAGKALSLLFLFPFAAFGVVGEDSSDGAAAKPSSDGKKRSGKAATKANKTASRAKSAM